MRIVKAFFKLTALVLVACVIALAISISYNKDCPAPDSSTAGANSYTAVVFNCYGPPEILQLTQLEKPVPAAGEILVKVQAAGVNPLDWHYMRGSPYLLRLQSGLGAPNNTRLGVDFSGTVEAVGPEVDNFQPGDKVFGGKNGAFAQYITVSSSGAIAHKPENISFAQAGTVGVAGVTALQALRDEGQLQSGQKVLINGASGGVGTYALQIAHAMGAEVTGVSSQRNHKLLRSLGANHVIDYKQQNYTEGAARYDLIVDMIGNHSPLANSKVLTPTGRIVLIGGAKGDWLGPLKSALLATLQSPFIEQETILLMASLNAADFKHLAELMSAGEMTPSVGKTYPLEEISDAMTLSESGRARGKIVIKIPHE